MGQSGVSSQRPLLLDLFCGAGGAAVGYHRAGFDVVGVDIAPQPRYPFEFIQADAMAVDLVRCPAQEVPRLFGHTFAGARIIAIHASPPCQRYTRAQNARKNADAHPDLVAPVRDRLQATGLPYVIENVVGAPLCDPVQLCGTSFGLQGGGYEHRRHRLFECNFPATSTECRHRLPAAPLFGHSGSRDFRTLYNGEQFLIEAKREAMGIDWMNRDEMAEAIPPAFTEYIGGYLMAEVDRRTVSSSVGSSSSTLSTPGSFSSASPSVSSWIPASASTVTRR